MSNMFSDVDLILNQATRKVKCHYCGMVRSLEGLKWVDEQICFYCVEDLR